MASVNKVIIVGNLGRDPETRTFPSGGQVCNIRVATTDRWKDKQSGEMREITEWHSIVFNDRLAEVAAQYLRKGSQVYVEGQLRTRKWTDKDGADRYSTEIRADQMQMLGGRQGQGGDDGSAEDGYQAEPRRAAAPPPAQRRAPAPAPNPAANRAPSGFDDMDDGSDIPF